PSQFIHPSSRCPVLGQSFSGAGKMRAHASLAISLFGLLVAVPAPAAPQQSEPASAIALPPDAVIGEISFAGLHRIPVGTAKARLSSHPGEKFNPAKTAADLHALTQLGWFEDVSLAARASQDALETSAAGSRRIDLEFRVSEYPILTAAEYNGSRVLSQ